MVGNTRWLQAALLPYTAFVFFLSREASKSWEDIQQHGFMQKMHACLISETSNLDFRKDEKKGAFAVFLAKNQFYHSKANKVFVDVWSKRDT